MRGLYRVPPVGWLLLAAGAQHLAAGQPFHGPGEGLLGLALALPWVALGAWAVVVFRRHRTTVHPMHPNRATSLVSDGPFAYTRNPMYLALAGLLVAHAVALSSWLALVPVLAFVVVIDRGQIAVEEAALRTGFGEEFVAYAARVPRWLGR